MGEPLKFHRIHGEHMQLSKSRKTATCTTTEKCQRFVFSAQPIGTHQKVTLRFKNPQPDQMFGFGFTTVNPEVLSEDISKFHQKFSGNTTWTVNVSTKDFSDGTQLTFYYDHGDNVTYFVNGELKSTFTKCDTKRAIWHGKPKWALIYVRGSGTAVTMVTVNQQRQQELSLPLTTVNNSGRGVTMATLDQQRQRELSLPLATVNNSGNPETKPSEKNQAQDGLLENQERNENWNEEAENEHQAEDEDASAEKEDGAKKEKEKAFGCCMIL